MTARNTSGFNEKDIFNTKVFLRAYNDAIENAKTLAVRDYAAD